MLIEVVALTQRLKDQGINVAREFDEHIIQTIRGKNTLEHSRPSILDRLHRARGQ